jgi:hypothetical protein
VWPQNYSRPTDRSAASTANGIVNIGSGEVEQKALFFTRPANTYVGANRIIALARRYNAASDVRIGIETEGENTVLAALGRTAVDVPVGEWRALDLGVFSRPSLPATAWKLVLSSTGTVAIGGLVMLSENTTSLWNGEGPRAEKAVTFSGVRNQVALEGAAYRDVTGYARGPIPTVPPASAPPALAFFSMNRFVLGVTRSHYVNVLERTR